MAEEIEKQLNKFYAPAVIRRLTSLPSKDQLPIGAWLVKTPVGTNYAMQILESLLDLSKKEETPASQILTQLLKEHPMADEWKEALPKEQGRQVRDLLQRRLHPVSSEHWERFQNFVKGLNLPKAVRLVPPKNFEGRQYHLDICFEDLEGLHEQLKTLQESLLDNNWNTLEEF